MAKIQNGPSPLEDAEHRLAQANHHAAELRRAIDHGSDTITAVDLANAQAEVELGQLRLEAARRNHRTADEVAHRIRVTTLIDELRDRPVADQADTLRRAYELAVAVLVDLHSATRTYQSMVDSRVHELTTLAPIPPDLASVHGGLGPMVRTDDGCMWATHHPNAEAVMVAAVLQAIHADMGADFVGIHGERLRHIAGPNTPADQQLWDELNTAHPGRTWPQPRTPA